MHTGPVVLLTEETRRVPSHGATDPVSEGLSALVRVSGPVAIHAPPSELDAIVLALGLAAALASYVPARRAMTVDPVETLTAE